MYHKSFYGETFYDPTKSDAIINFKYSGADYSIIYNYFFSPLAQFLVDRVFPEWLA